MIWILEHHIDIQQEQRESIAIKNAESKNKRKINLDVTAYRISIEWPCILLWCAAPSQTSSGNVEERCGGRIVVVLRLGGWAVGGSADGAGGRKIVAKSGVGVFRFVAESACSASWFFAASEAVFTGAVSEMMMCCSGVKNVGQTVGILSDFILLSLAHPWFLCKIKLNKTSKNMILKLISLGFGNCF